MDIIHRLGTVIRQRREALGLRQQDFSKDGEDKSRQSSLSRLERHKAGVSIERLLEIAEWLNTTPVELLLEAERPENKAAPKDGRTKAATQAREEIRSRSERLKAYALVTELMISTTPGGAPALRELLRKFLVTRDNDYEREFLQGLLNRADFPAAARTPRGASKRGRASSR